MKCLKMLLLIFFLVSTGITDALCQNKQDIKEITIKWQNEKPQGHIEVLNGDLQEIKLRDRDGKVKENQYSFRSAGLHILDISLKNTHVNYGPATTVVSVYNGNHSFSFFLRDVNYDYPIYIPEYNVIICSIDDNRTYQQIENDIKSRGLKTKLEKIENEPEESFDSAAVHTRNQICPIWLGLSRDIRIFELQFEGEINTISPRMASTSITLPETNNTRVNYSYMTGRGQAVVKDISRRLDEGVLPILNVTLNDEDIEYNSTIFVSNEYSPLNEKAKMGTDFLVADYYSAGNMFTDDQIKLLKPLLHADSLKTEETVIYYRAEAVNNSDVPRYAFFRTLRPGSGWWEKVKYSFDNKTGFSAYSSDRIFGISKLNGKPLPNEEISVLLKPDEKAVFEFYIPHNPISEERALKLANQSFDERYEECRNFWKAKLNNAAKISVPEKRIDEMIKAGLLHLDLVTYGNEPDGTLAPCIGVYSPIGTESSPIIQFYSSLGLNDIAKRSLMYFLDKQHDDGLIQNFNGYMVETGAALWSMGEYYRTSRDTGWVKQVEPKLLKSCEYLLQWRNRNKKESLRGKGYGMIDGKVADPEDPYHQFMLNGYGYLGLSRVAEMLILVDPVNSKRLKQEADMWKNDIRASFFNSMASSPVVPLGDGTWCPTVPPWTETNTLRLLYLYPETFMSHGTFTVADAMLGPLYLVFCEVIDPKEKAGKMLLDYHSELFYLRNAAFSQPYYSRHNWIQLKLGMVKPFLKTYYNTVSALADRETYTFWEHLYHASVHKTHEEAWFLMETRWMLYFEDESTLRLLSGVPRKWLGNGQKIEVRNVASYFGTLSFSVDSHIDNNYIEATVECSSQNMPDQVAFRIPHPSGKKAVNVTGGTYDGASETVTIKPFTGRANIKLEY
jgi:hypothetical protein